MQKNNAAETAKIVMRCLKETFGDEAGKIVLSGVTDIPNKSFCIKYVLYDYFCMRFSYDRGHFGTCIEYGENSVSIRTESEWDDNCNYSKYWNEVREDIRLRIPDKYLEKHNW